jgi:hypothetical protein
MPIASQAVSQQASQLLSQPFFDLLDPKIRTSKPFETLPKICFKGFFFADEQSHVPHPQSPPLTIGMTGDA